MKVGTTLNSYLMSVKHKLYVYTLLSKKVVTPEFAETFLSLFLKEPNYITHVAWNYNNFQYQLVNILANTTVHSHYAYIE